MGNFFLTNMDLNGYSRSLFSTFSSWPYAHLSLDENMCTIKAIHYLYQRLPLKTYKLACKLLTPPIRRGFFFMYLREIDTVFYATLYCL